MLYATAPLTISSSTVSIADASITSSGIVSIGLQGFAGAKNFNDGFTASGTQLITDISTDSTFVTATDVQLATKKAIKDYIATVASSLSLIEPLYYSGTDLAIRDASLTTYGVLTTTAQSIAGTKTFSNEIVVNSLIELSHVVSNTIRSTASGSKLVLTSLANGSTLELQSAAYGGDLVLQSAPVAACSIRLETGNPLISRILVDDSNIYQDLPVTITSVVTPQLTIVASHDSADLSVSGTGLVIANSVHQTHFHSSDIVTVENTTASTSTVTGALVVKGGIGAADAVHCTKCQIKSPALGGLVIEASGTDIASLGMSLLGTLTLDAAAVSPKISFSYNGTPSHSFNASLTQLTGTLSAGKVAVTSSPGIYTDYETSVGGNTTITSTGTTLNLVQAGSANAVCDNTYFRTNKGLEINGSLKYNSTPAFYTLTGAGPFNDYVITTLKTFIYFTITAMTPAAHLTGLSCSGPPASFRIIELYFYSAVANSITFEHEAAGSLAGYRIVCPNSGNLVIVVNPVASVRLVYDSVINRWAILSFS